MASIYDKIETAKDLLIEVKIHGLSTKAEDICRAQDIFGRATLQELIALANDNGRMNGDGEADPNGSWSNGRDGLQKTFYSVLFHIWNWEDATRFWNMHTNPEYASLKKIASNAKHLEASLALAESLSKTNAQRVKLLSDDLVKAENENSNLTAKVKAQEEEILKLKARLYDLIVAGK